MSAQMQSKFQTPKFHVHPIHRFRALPSVYIPVKLSKYNRTMLRACSHNVIRNPNDWIPSSNGYVKISNNAQRFYRKVVLTPQRSSPKSTASPRMMYRVPNASRRIPHQGFSRRYNSSATNQLITGERLRQASKYGGSLFVVSNTNC